MTGKPDHILRAFDHELDQLRSNVLRMANLAAESVRKAAESLTEGSLEKCLDVIGEDEAIDQLNKDIDRDGMAFLLRYNPVASDLRMVVSSLNISRSLERIGDHAVNIAKRARKIAKAGGCEESRLLQPLAEKALGVLDLSTRAYADSDSDIGLRAIDADQEVDRMHKKLSKSLSQMIADHPENAETLLHVLFSIRFLERVGDLSVNIAEDLVFIDSAEDIRHQ